MTNENPTNQSLADDEEVIKRVRTCRAEGASPKRIARALGLSPAAVAQILQSAQFEVDWASPELSPGEKAVLGCWVSPGWSDGLGVPGHPEWLAGESRNPGSAGLAGVVVAREHRRGTVSVCSYLIDVYCLGVKDVIGPKIINDGLELLTLTRRFFSAFDAAPVPAPLELARHLVLGAVDYALDLGFQPHPDFASAAAHLGPWTGPSAITFGRDGKPFYVQGPNDNPAEVMRALQRSAGTEPDSFHFLTGVPA